MRQIMFFTGSQHFQQISQLSILPNHSSESLSLKPFIRWFLLHRPFKRPLICPLSYHEDTSGSSCLPHRPCSFRNQEHDEYGCTDREAGCRAACSIQEHGLQAGPRQSIALPPHRLRDPDQQKVHRKFHAHVTSESMIIPGIMILHGIIIPGITFIQLSNF